MVNLKCKTREGTSSKNKPKVYFSAHPDDFKYFEEISNEILKRQNCAIYYLDDFDSTINTDDFEFQLSNMQLIVFPITVNLLTSNNRALNIEIEYAKKNNIQLLPLMYDSGIDFKFNEVIGNYQFLDKFRIDETAISYDKKLTDFLNSALISDELIKQIQDTFDAYIFLSYRKKDRKYANELMKLIHSEKELEDIAIWFDEFLTPGEDFNGEIENILNKSDIFALLVTPSIIEKGNYVLTCEYPMAQKINKPIVPIESVKTDKKELLSNYKNIPPIIEAIDTKNISKNLLSYIHKRIRNKNESNLHNYLIALAYIYGIAMEVNVELGIKILNECADKGYVPAIKKLASMYEYGSVGTTLNIEKAIELNIRLLNEVGNDYKISSIYENLGRLYEKINDYKASLTYLLKENELLDKKDSDYAISLANIANSYIKQNDLSQAQNYLNKSASILLEKSSKDINDLYYLSCQYHQYAFLLYKTNDYDNSYKHYKMAIELLEKILNENREEFLYSLGKFYLNFIQLLIHSDLYSEAKENLVKANDIFNELEESNKEIYKLEMAKTYSLLASLYKELEMNDLVKNNYLKAINILKDAYDKYPSIYNKSIATLYNNYAIFLMEENNLEEAEKFFNTALDIYRKSGDSQIEISMINGNIAAILTNKKAYDKALSIFKSNIDLYTDLRGSNEKHYDSLIANTYSNMACLELEKENYKDAIKLFVLALNLYSTLDNHNEEIAYNSRLLAQLYLYTSDYNNCLKYYSISFDKYISLFEISAEKYIDTFQDVYEEYSGLLLELKLEDDLNIVEDKVSKVLEKFNN